MLDSREFNDRLFYPRSDVSAGPEGSVDFFIGVPGARLHARLHDAPHAQTSVLFFHGNGEVVSDYDHVAPSFAAIGASLAVVDYRGYGLSTGRPTLRSAVLDAAPALRAVHERLTRERQLELPLVVMGRSLGSACAAELYGLAAPEVSGFVLESGFTDLTGLVLRRGLPAPPAFDEDERDAFDPLPKLRRGSRPLLVLHGAADQLVPAHEGRAAFEAAGTDNKKLVLIDGRGHNDISGSPRYWQALADFFASVR